MEQSCKYLKEPVTGEISQHPQMAYALIANCLRIIPKTHVCSGLRIIMMQYLFDVRLTSYGWGTNSKTV